MLSRLKLELRHKQLFDIKRGVNIIVQCDSNGTAQYIDGNVSQSNWVDFTNDVENLDELKLTWQAATGDVEGAGGNAFGSNYSKGVSLEMRFMGAAFQFIFDWLMTTECQRLNAVDVRITDLDCAKVYRVFEIKLDNTKYMPEVEPCIISMRLREKDEAISALQATIIEDDWQKWFNETNDSLKAHPTFMYIVEKKPKFILVFLVVLMYIIGIFTKGIWTATTLGRRFTRKLLGVCYFCPSPLVRTYIDNFCSKYGYTFDTMFDDLPGNVYRDVCLFYPVEKNLQEFDDYVANSTAFLFENRTGLSVDKFLDQLKRVFNAEWYVTPGKKLVFKHKSFFDNQAPVYDFTTGNFKIRNLVYTFNGNKKPAYGDYSWQLDPGDSCTNEIKWRYDTIVQYSKNVINPMLEGHITKQFDFAMTAFNRDGTVEPYLESAIKIGRDVAVVVMLGLQALFGATGGWTIFLAVGLVLAAYLLTNSFINNFFKDSQLDGAIRLSNNQCNIPRLLVYDRATALNQAKVLHVVNPAKNTEYNTVNDYYQAHPTRDEPGFFGDEVRNIHNYPLYVDEDFKNNLYDLHEYDNPLKNTIINQSWEGNVDLCCEMLDTFGVWEGDYAKIGAVVILENRNGRLIKGRIEEIEPSYKDGLMNLKGRVLK